MEMTMMVAADGGEAATKDDIMNLEDKLDQLMAEFEDLMGGNDDMGDMAEMATFWVLTKAATLLKWTTLKKWA
jgi:hypothetical protein